MKFSFVTVLFTSAVLTQKVKILLGNDEYSIIGGNGFGCYRSDNRAFGIRAPRNVEVKLYKNGDCGGDSYLRTWGRAWFRRPFEYCSVELVRRGNGGSYDDCEDNDDGDSGYDGY
jgi:hypothetical protein